MPNYKLPFIISILAHSALVALVWLSSLLVKSWVDIETPKQPNYINAKLFDLTTKTKQISPDDTAKEKTKPEEVPNKEEPVVVDNSKVEELQAQEAKERVEQQKAAEQKRAEEAKQAEQKKQQEAEQQERERQAKLQQQKLKEAEAKLKAEQEAQRKRDEERKRKLAEQKKKEEEAAAKKREQEKKDEIAKRMEQEQKAKEAAALRERLNAEQAQNSAQSYTREIANQIKAAWRKPSSSSGKVVVLRINFTPSGEVRGEVEIVKSSGDSAFDDSAIRAVRKVGTFDVVRDIPSDLFEREFRRHLIKFTRPEE